jgi:hypothetical protein
MSCTSLLYSDDDENAAGHCDDKTRSCILSSQNMTLSLSINIVNYENMKVCESYSGLWCADNETLVACSGVGKSEHYTVSCNGVAIPNAGSFLQGQCYKNSCISVTVHQTNNSDTQAEQSENYASYDLPPPNVKSSISEPLFSNTNSSDLHEESEIVIHQVEVFELYDEHDALKYSLSKAEQEHFVDDRNGTKIHTRNSSSGDVALTTDSAEETSQIAQDDLSQTDADLTLAKAMITNTGESDLHLKFGMLRFSNMSDLTNPASTEIHSQTSLLNVDHILVTPETKLNTEKLNPPTSATFSQTSLSVSGTTPTETATQVTTSVPSGLVSYPHVFVPTGTTRSASSHPDSIPTETATAVITF